MHSHNGCGFSKWINAVFRPLINFVVDKRLACSVHAASWLFGKKYIEKTLVVKNGIDVDKFVFHDCYRTELRKEYKIEDKFVVGHIGRFSEQKNHVFLLKIFEKILKKRPDSILFLVGDGELYNDVWKEISRKCLQDKIIHVKRTDKSYMFYCAFDCFCMPSLYEGLPIVGVEAQTAGLQCFFSKNISPEIELTDHCHLLSLNESPEHWADCILEVECSDDRRACAENVRLKGFDIRSTTAQIADIYETIK